MKNRTTYLLLMIALGCAGFAAPSPSYADGNAPACATNGDKDGDGVLDADDSAEADSCSGSASGYEDCSTGAGDGIPDCDDGIN